MYRVYEHAIAVRTSSHVTFYTNNIYVYNINRFVRFAPLARLQYTIRRESKEGSYIVGFGKVYSVGVFDFAL